MMRLIAARLLGLVGALWLAAPGYAQDKAISPLPSHLPLRTEACFGRVYDAAHLRSHPKQRVTSFLLSRDFALDENQEEVHATSDDMRTEDGSDGGIITTAYVRFRDKPGLFHNALYCRRSDDGTVRCGIDCDGGGFKLRGSGKSLLVENQGFVVTGGCGASDEENEQRDFVSPGADDRVFRLDPQPLAVCTAAREALKPTWAKLGEPLRVRLNRDNAVCFSRSYDAAHLARNPKQTVRRIAVLKTSGTGPKHDAMVFALTFRIELKNGRKFEKQTDCSPERYAYACTHDPKYDMSQDFYLTRAGDEAIMLRDRKGKLTDLFGTRLGTDDRMFRLQKSPAEACEF